MKKDELRKKVFGKLRSAERCLKEISEEMNIANLDISWDLLNVYEEFDKVREVLNREFKDKKIKTLEEIEMKDMDEEFTKMMIEDTKKFLDERSLDKYHLLILFLHLATEDEKKKVVEL